MMHFLTMPNFKEQNNRGECKCEYIGQNDGQVVYQKTIN